jgi:ElaB/YqjD/DUF883 family membrane-anchored ribosome-binding protein
MEHMDTSSHKLMDDLKVVVSDAEALMSATAGFSSDGAAKARARAAESLDMARNRITAWEQQLTARAKAGAKATNDYVHDSPWPAIGVAAGVAFVAGLLVARR